MFKEHFNLRKSVLEVGEIMKFQFEQKKLQYKMIISENVPTKIFSDVKRFK